MKFDAVQGSRILSLDQFRGYTVAGMFFVNFLGGYAAIPAIFNHHATYFSLADTIMPQFFFAVGFAYRLTFLRALERDGRWAACRHAVNRNLGLVLLGFVFYNLDGGVKHWSELQALGLWGFLSTAFRSSPFEALTHIGLTGLWILPVIAAGVRARVVFMAASAGLYLLLSYLFYFEWGAKNVIIDGGQLGFMTWAIPTLAGSFAYDIMTAKEPLKALAPLLLCAVVVMAMGYAISCLNAVHHTIAGDASANGVWKWLVEPPFVPPIRPPDLWTMNQMAGSVSYMVFGTGFSLLVYALFVALSDVGPVRIGLFRTFGSNALAAYILHTMVAEAVAPWVPNDSPLAYALFGFAVFFGIIYLFVRHLEKHAIYIRL